MNRTVFFGFKVVFVKARKEHVEKSLGYSEICQGLGEHDRKIDNLTYKLVNDFIHSAL